MYPGELSTSCLEERGNEYPNNIKSVFKTVFQKVFQTSIQTHTANRIKESILKSMQTSWAPPSGHSGAIAGFIELDAPSFGGLDFWAYFSWQGGWACARPVQGNRQTAAAHQVELALFKVLSMGWQEQAGELVGRALYEGRLRSSAEICPWIGNYGALLVLIACCMDDPEVEDGARPHVRRVARWCHRVLGPWADGVKG